VLPEAVAGQQRVRVRAREVHEHAAQPVHGAEQREELLALEHVDAHRAEVAGAPRQMEASADLLGPLVPVNFPGVIFYRKEPTGGQRSGVRGRRRRINQLINSLTHQRISAKDGSAFSGNALVNG